MIYYSKIVKIKMDYITKYQYVKLIHFLRRHHFYKIDQSLVGSSLSSYLLHILKLNSI